MKCQILLVLLLLTGLSLAAPQEDELDAPIDWTDLFDSDTDEGDGWQAALDDFDGPLDDSEELNNSSTEDSNLLQNLENVAEAEGSSSSESGSLAPLPTPTPTSTPIPEPIQAVKTTNDAENIAVTTGTLDPTVETMGVPEGGVQTTPVPQAEASETLSSATTTTESTESGNIEVTAQSNATDETTSEKEPSPFITLGVAAGVIGLLILALVLINMRLAYRRRRRTRRTFSSYFDWTDYSGKQWQQKGGDLTMAGAAVTENIKYTHPIHVDYSRSGTAVSGGFGSAASSVYPTFRDRTEWQHSQLMPHATSAATPPVSVLTSATASVANDYVATLSQSLRSSAPISYVQPLDFGPSGAIGRTSRKGSVTSSMSASGYPGITQRPPTYAEPVEPIFQAMLPQHTAQQDSPRHQVQPLDADHCEFA